jgi:hypothetical protein
MCAHLPSWGSEFEFASTFESEMWENM